jgi:hypothetical protein
VTASLNVTTGSAFGGAAGSRMLKAAMNCSVLMRRRTFSWATMSDPASPRSLLPPVWSPCQCVLSTKRMGLSVSAATAALIFGVSGAYSSSIRNAVSAPTERPMLPPAPLSM